MVAGVVSTLLTDNEESAAFRTWMRPEPPFRVSV